MNSAAKSMPYTHERWDKVVNLSTAGAGIKKEESG
jgi:hypothetical protein